MNYPRIDWAGDRFAGDLYNHRAEQLGLRTCIDVVDAGANWDPASIVRLDMRDSASLLDLQECDVLSVTIRHKHHFVVSRSTKYPPSRTL